jgi:hypothetical protein
MPYETVEGWKAGLGGYTVVSADAALLQLTSNCAGLVDRVHDQQLQVAGAAAAAAALASKGIQLAGNSSSMLMLACCAALQSTAQVCTSPQAVLQAVSRWQAVSIAAVQHLFLQTAYTVPCLYVHWPVCCSAD